MMTKEKISEIVAGYYELEFTDMVSRIRKREICKPRQVAMYFSRKETGDSLAVIGNFFGREHATVLHASKVISNEYDTNRDFRLTIDRIQDLIDKKINTRKSSRPVECSGINTGESLGPVECLDINTGESLGPVECLDINTETLDKGDLIPENKKSPRDPRPIKALEVSIEMLNKAIESLKDEPLKTEYLVLKDKKNINEDRLRLLELKLCKSYLMAELPKLLKEIDIIDNKLEFLESYKNHKNSHYALKPRGL